MNILLFDPFNGAAGDMVIGSLLDLGADEEAVRAAMRSVVGEPTIERVDRSG
ncbi:nickel insertion protein, partial [Methanoculleus bourgensis]